MSVQTKIMAMKRPTNVRLMAVLDESYEESGDMQPFNIYMANMVSPDPLVLSEMISASRNAHFDGKPPKFRNPVE